LQALTLFNSDFMQQQSAQFASRLERECNGSPDCEMRRAYKLSLARTPRPVELAMGKQFLGSGGKLAGLWLALMDRNEVVYRPLTYAARADAARHSRSCWTRLRRPRSRVPAPRFGASQGQGESARRQAAELCAQGQVRDLSVYGGRAEPHRHV